MRTSLDHFQLQFVWFWSAVVLIELESSVMSAIHIMNALLCVVCFANVIVWLCIMYFAKIEVIELTHLNACFILSYDFVMWEKWPLVCSIFYGDSNSTLIYTIIDPILIILSFSHLNISWVTALCSGDRMVLAGNSDMRRPWVITRPMQVQNQL